MSARLLTLAYKAKLGSTNRKLVLIRLIDAAKDDGSNIFPSVQTIADGLEMSERTVQRILRDFETEGLIECVSRQQGGWRYARRYRLRLEALRALIPKSEEGDPEGVTPEAARGDSIVSPLNEPEGVTNRAQGVTPEVERGDTAVSPEPSKKTPQRRKRGGSLRSPPRARSTPDLFEGRGDGAAEEHEPPADVRAAFDAWNDLAEETGLSRAQILTEPRQRSLTARLRDCGGLEGWGIALGKVRHSSFLCGGGERGFRASLDFVLRASKFTRLMEGTYDDRKGGKRKKRTAYTVADDMLAGQHPWTMDDEDEDGL